MYKYAQTYAQQYNMYPPQIVLSSIRRKPSSEESLITPYDSPGIVNTSFFPYSCFEKTSKRTLVIGVLGKNCFFEYIAVQTYTDMLF